MNSKDFLKVAKPETIDVMNAEANRMAADLAALRAENQRLRELLENVNAILAKSPYRTNKTLAQLYDANRAALA